MHDSAYKKRDKGAAHHQKLKKHEAKSEGHSGEMHEQHKKMHKKEEKKHKEVEKKKENKEANEERGEKAKKKGSKKEAAKESEAMNKKKKKMMKKQTTDQDHDHEESAPIEQTVGLASLSRARRNQALPLASSTISNSTSGHKRRQTLLPIGSKAGSLQATNNGGLIDHAALGKHSGQPLNKSSEPAGSAPIGRSSAPTASSPILPQVRVSRQLTDDLPKLELIRRALGHLNGGRRTDVSELAKERQQQASGGGGSNFLQNLLVREQATLMRANPLRPVERDHQIRDSNRRPQVLPASSEDFNGRRVALGPQQSHSMFQGQPLGSYSLAAAGEPSYASLQPRPLSADHLMAALEGGLQLVPTTPTDVVQVNQRLDAEDNNYLLEPPGSWQFGARPLSSQFLPFFAAD